MMQYLIFAFFCEKRDGRLYYLKALLRSRVMEEAVKKKKQSSKIFTGGMYFFFFNFPYIYFLMWVRVCFKYCLISTLFTGFFFTILYITDFLLGSTEFYLIWIYWEVYHLVSNISKSCIDLCFYILWFKMK